MRYSLASEPVPGAANEDFAVVSPSAAVVLDGAAMPATVDTGCVHGTPWFVRRLACAVLDHALGEGGLADVLASAITDVAGLHAGTCQPCHPCAPSATVALARLTGENLEYLVLGDAFLLLDTAEGLRAVSDDRFAQVGSTTRAKVWEVEVGTPEHQRRFADHIRSVRQLRNRPDGYWQASGEPEAAGEALTGSVPLAGLHRWALLSDGATRPVDRFGLYDWPTWLDLLDTEGPEALFQRVREIENRDHACTRWPRSKRHDDLSAVFVRP